jgi:cytochrome c oxidase cbb3-type subunit 3
MSKDSTAVQAGALTFQTTCASCHMPDLSGKIGPNLKDNLWIHGGKPVEIVHTITTGVAAKGMPTWGPVLGPTKINEVAAFILSYHSPSDPVIPANQAAAAASAPPATK